MKKEKHEDILKEVVDEIDAAVKDQRGLVAHQRRLAFSLSLGATNLLELHFHNLDIIKEGSKINHLWFKKKKERIYERLQKQIAPPIETIEKIGEITDLICKIEEKRDDLAYGAPATDEILQDKINLFLKLKKLLKC